MEVRNRFKDLDRIDSVPDELWNEVRDIVQEKVIKIIPMEKTGTSLVVQGLRSVVWEASTRHTATKPVQ